MHITQNRVIYHNYQTVKKVHIYIVVMYNNC
jgi:hypothetical protein